MEPSPTESTSSDTNFSQMTVKELKEELKKKNAKGFSNENKAELIKQMEEICQRESMELHIE